MGALSMMGGMFGGFAGICSLEHLLKAYLQGIPLFARLFGPSTLLGGVVPALYGGVLLVNVFGSSLMLMRLGMIPGMARKEFIEKGKKDGDKGEHPCLRHFRSQHPPAIASHPTVCALPRARAPAYRHFHLADAEDRYSYPKLYAEGFSPLAKHFNCHQRAHQQVQSLSPCLALG